MKYCLQVISVLLFFLFFSQFTPKAFAVCENIQVHFSAPTVKTGTTATSFDFAGNTQNCSSAEGVGGVKLILHNHNDDNKKGTAQTAGDRVYNLTITPNTQRPGEGVFQQGGVIIPFPGSWEAYVSPTSTGKYVSNDAGPFILTITGEVHIFDCGQSSQDPQMQCKPECPAISIGNNTWRCGGDSSTTNPTIAAACSATVTIDAAPDCDASAQITDATYCLNSQQKTGIVCPNPAAVPCKKDNQPKCQVFLPTPNQDYAFSPSPTPFNPPCSRFVDAQGQTTTDPSKIFRCATVNGAFADFATDPNSFVTWLFGLLLSISGAVLIVIFIMQGYRLMTSQGKPETIQAAREAITSAVVGLLFMIFALVILEIIGVDILHLDIIFKH